ncbi:glycosyltransferase [Aestuariispira ectoiniformans]|uniref:glycosyltransferase n=1 Tax=Aestuariispira ectoiniformans TaxID=2775080 RepID=UPI00223A8D07|nr:glycosyltransferase [Aestuariispira ectoiniformans]
MRLNIVLPIYNERENLEKLFADIDKACTEAQLRYFLVCVNDGSSDGSKELLEELSKRYESHIVEHRLNRGLGETIRDGFECAAELSGADDIIIRLDADNTHAPQYIPDLVNAIRDGADIAIASRFLPGGGMVGLSNDRTVISKVANIIFRVCFPMGGLQEYTCGYRAYRASLIQRAIDFYKGNFLQLRGLGFCCTVEKLVKLKLLGAKLQEVPFVLRYDLKASESKIALNVTTFGYAMMTILYHWPQGGWRRTVRKRLRVQRSEQ